MSIQLVGLAGYARTGKNTAANNMPGFAQLAFADNLKKDLTPLLESIRCTLTKPEHKELARPLMVAWGALARAMMADHWIRRLKIDFSRSVGKFQNTKIVITDCRYKNELAWVESLGGKIVMIERPGYGPANHEEERSFKEIADTCSTLVVVNDSTPEALGRRVLEVTGNG